jgi:hypothetical protein
MDNLEQEVNDLLHRHAEDTADDAQARLDRRAVRRMDLRDRLRDGDPHLPEHLRSCATCIRAVLTLDHNAACAVGKRFVHLILP